MGMLMEATVPTSHRWIPKAMNVQYLAKATTSLRATARLDPPDFDAISEGTEIVVPVSVVDRSGAEVVHADITTWVTPASGVRLRTDRDPRRNRDLPAGSAAEVAAPPRITPSSSPRMGTDASGRSR